MGLKSILVNIGVAGIYTKRQIVVSHTRHHVTSRQMKINPNCMLPVAWCRATRGKTKIFVRVKRL
jgi:hypothetical protein